MRISTFFYTLKQGIVNIFRNKWFSLASVATISSCLFLFGLFYTVIVNFQYMIRNAEGEMSVTAFLQEDATEEQIQQVGEMIRGRAEVARVDFISDEQAWAEWAPENIGEDYMDIYSENPFENMNSYEIYMNDVEQQQSLVDWLQSLPDISEVHYSEVTATTLTGMNAIVAYVSLGIIVILLLVSIFLINNTVIIGISVRRQEIEIMKAIGATDFFVRSPFVIEGILIGLVGSLIPLAAIYFIYIKVMDYVGIQFPALTTLLQFLPVQDVFKLLLPISLGIGAGIGFLGSFTTVRKHLRV